MIDLDSVLSLTEFKRNTSDFVDEMKKTGNPLVLTVNGKAELVVLDKKLYQDLVNRIEYADNVLRVKEAMESFEKGEGKAAREALEHLNKISLFSENR